MRHLGIALLALSGLACGAGPGGSTPPGALRVAVSIPPHAWLVGRIGGPAVEIVTVLPPGNSPATFQPSDAEVSRVLTSRVLFCTGVPFESGSWRSAVAERVAIVNLQDGVADRIMDDHEHDGGPVPAGLPHPHGPVDPHAWLSPRRLAVQARTVARELIRIQPEQSDQIDTALGELLAELDELDRWIAAELAPYRGRAFVVFHPSWGYFADDYGLTQIAIESAGKEPSDAELTEIRRRVEELRLSVVFVQPQIAGLAARALADSVGARLETLDPLAPDVPANLRRVTTAIAGGFHD